MGAQTKKLTINKRTTSPTPTVTPQGTPALASYSYKLVAKAAATRALPAPHAAAGTAGSTTTGATTLGLVDFNRITWTDAAAAVSYDVYRTVGGATQGLIGTVLAGVQTFDDVGLVADGSTAPTTNTSGTGEVTSVAHFLAAAIQCSGGGSAFTATVQVEGSIDGVEWESVGSAFTAGGFADLSRRYALLRANVTAYTSGDPQIHVHGVAGSGE